MTIKKSGQTLIEVMVALLVLTTGFLGILALLSQSIYISKNIGNETTATYLASEGIELAKNLIDHDVYAHLAGVPGATGWGSCFTPSGGDYELDYTTTDCSALHVYNAGDPDVLYYNSTTHLYLYNFDNIVGTITPTDFTRLIRVCTTGSCVDGQPNQIDVQSIVSWQVGLGTQSVDLEDHFYNWHP